MRPKKRFGQHFLHDENILEEMEKQIAPQSTEHLVEIGPGEGALTKYIVKHAGKFTAVEIDRDLIPVLKKQYTDQKNFHLIEQDALTFDFGSLADTQYPALRIFGNLPYNISTPLLFHLFSNAEKIIDMHFLLQKEVVDRLVAEPGNKTYGRLSVMAQYHADLFSLFDVPPHAFRPPPKVDSAFIRIIPKKTKIPVKNMDIFSNIVRDAFNQRRKTIRNSLRAHISAEKLLELEIDPQKRPEELSVGEFARISNAS